MNSPKISPSFSNFFFFYHVFFKILQIFNMKNDWKDKKKSYMHDCLQGSLRIDNLLHAIGKMDH